LYLIPELGIDKIVGGDATDIVDGVSGGVGGADEPTITTLLPPFPLSSANTTSQNALCVTKLSLL
jgi:hypothetical protein